MTKVMKFGGGCFRDARGVGLAADIVAAENPAPAIVVSAVAGVTDKLVAAIQKAA